MWPATFNHALENPIFGWGLGSARLLVAGVLPRKEAEQYHPHNEYLQVFHDMGVVGVILLLLAWILLLTQHWRGWKAAHLAANYLQAKWHMASTLSIGMVLITSVTDNTLHYTFVVGPVFMLVALASHYSGNLETHGYVEVARKSTPVPRKRAVFC
jgi:O-antigen ligase